MYSINILADAASPKHLTDLSAQPERLEFERK